MSIWHSNSGVKPDMHLDGTCSFPFLPDGVRLIAQIYDNWNNVKRGEIFIKGGLFCGNDATHLRYLSLALC